MLGSKTLILVEEVWQFKGLDGASLNEKCMPSGRIRRNNWGWHVVPELMESVEEYLVVPAEPLNLMKINEPTLEAMIKKSIADFQRINGFA